MAFFSNKEGPSYFGIFYFEIGNGKISGTFHELKSTQADAFAWMYKTAAIYSLVALLVQICVAGLSLSEFIPWNDYLFVFFLISAVLPVCPLAAYIVGKKKVKLENMPLTLERKKSVFVYVFVVAVTVNYCVTLTWGAIANHGALSIYIFLLMMIAIAGSFRLFSISKAKDI